LNFKSVVLSKPVGTENEKLSEVKIEIDQYHSMWDKKNSYPMPDILANHLELWENTNNFAEMHPN